MLRSRGAYFDVNGLHAMRAVESYVTAYGAESTVRRHRCVLFLLAQGNGDETVTPHENARGRPPTQTCGSSEDPL